MDDTDNNEYIYEILLQTMTNGEIDEESTETYIFRKEENARKFVEDYIKNKRNPYISNELYESCEPQIDEENEYYCWNRRDTEICQVWTGEGNDEFNGDPKMLVITLFEKMIYQ